jgi:SAM-dependent methyltransferase
MNRAYWDAVADDYEGEVLSVFDHDTGGLVRARIAAAGAAVDSAGSRAADLGCGVGKFTPLLARAFARVEACDSSLRGLEAARAACLDHANVGFWRIDLTCDPVPFEPVHFVLCVNVLIMPSLDERLRAWRTVTNQVEHGGTLLLVVPSLESIQCEHLREIDTHLLEGDTCAEAIRRSVPPDASATDLHQGVHLLDGLRTKHYLREELEHMLPAHELDVIEVARLEYRTDAEDVADALPAASCPWDWLVTARRR